MIQRISSFSTSGHFHLDLHRSRLKSFRPLSIYLLKIFLLTLNPLTRQGFCLKLISVAVVVDAAVTVVIVFHAVVVSFAVVEVVVTVVIVFYTVAVVEDVVTVVIVFYTVAVVEVVVTVVPGVSAFCCCCCCYF